MKILITGASGFLGRHLSRILKQQGYEIVVLTSQDADLTRQDSLSKFKQIRFERIFHLACWTQPGDFCLRHLGQQWLINQQINTTVLNWWLSCQPQAKLVSIGTSLAYPEGQDLIEENYLKGLPPQGAYVYAMTKRMLHIGKQALNRQYGLNYLTLVSSALYGPDYHKGRKNQHFIYDLIKKILEFKYYKKPVVLWGDGSQERDLILVDDFIDSMLKLDNFVSNDIVNIGSGKGCSIREYSDTICRMLEVDNREIRYDTSKFSGTKSKILNIEKLNGLLPERKTISLEEGLSSTIQWMKQEYFEPLKGREKK